MKEEMRESYLALKKLAKTEFFEPLRAFVQKGIAQQNEVSEKYDGRSGPTVKDEMRESYFAIKKVAEDVIGKPARVAREMIATQSVDMKSIYAKVEADTRTAGPRQNGDDKPLAGGASGAAP
jgi:hypothetical protein